MKLANLWAKAGPVPCLDVPYAELAVPPTEAQEKVAPDVINVPQVGGTTYPKSDSAMSVLLVPKQTLVLLRVPPTAHYVLSGGTAWSQALLSASNAQKAVMLVLKALHLSSTVQNVVLAASQTLVLTMVQVPARRVLLVCTAWHQV